MVVSAVAYRDVSVSDLFGIHYVDYIDVEHRGVKWYWGPVATNFSVYQERRSRRAGAFGRCA